MYIKLHKCLPFYSCLTLHCTNNWGNSYLYAYLKHTQVVAFYHSHGNSSQIFHTTVITELFLALIRCRVSFQCHQENNRLTSFRWNDFFVSEKLAHLALSTTNLVSSPHCSLNTEKFMGYIYMNMIWLTKKCSPLYKHSRYFDEEGNSPPHCPNTLTSIQTSKKWPRVSIAGCTVTSECGIIQVYTSTPDYCVMCSLHSRSKKMSASHIVTTGRWDTSMKYINTLTGVLCLLTEGCLTFVDIPVSSCGQPHAFLAKATSSSSKQKWAQVMDSSSSSSYSPPSDIRTSTFIRWLLAFTRMWRWKTVFWFGHSQACFS